MLETKTPRAYHLCTLALAVEWIFFGSCHFTFRAATEAEIPPFILAFTHLDKTFEVVSDWLTKIIVGVGLVEFHHVGEFLTGISSDLGQALAPQTGAASFAKALIVYFFIAGIIQGYLLTRMYVGRQFRD